MSRGGYLGLFRGCIGSGDDEREEETNVARWPLRAYTVERQCVMAVEDSANAVCECCDSSGDAVDSG